MGEYAVDQMMRDFKRMTGIDADRSDFEDDDISPIKRPVCPKCGKKFRVAQAIRDHLRDKHGLESA